MMDYKKNHKTIKNSSVYVPLGRTIYNVAAKRHFRQSRVHNLLPGSRVVGVTDACDYPPEAHVCSWFDPDIGRIRALEPDLVIGLENAHTKMQAVFEAEGIQLVLHNPECMPDVLTAILNLGELLVLHQAARKLIDNLQKRINRITEHVRQMPPDKYLTVCWMLKMIS